MQPLAGDQLDAFRSRFHGGRDGRLLAVEVRLARGGVAAVTFTVAVRDAQRDDAETEVRLQVGAVAELRLQVRPTEDPQALAEGINIDTFKDLVFVDVLPWTDRPAGVHDFRASSCYAAGTVLRWEVVGEVG